MLYAGVGCCGIPKQQSLSQADNSTYLMESFHKLVHDLEEPLGGETRLPPKCTL